MPAQRKKKKAAPRKQIKTVRRIRTVKTAEHTKLEVYAIWLNEYYQSLKQAGFTDDLCLALIMDKASYPSWVNFEIPKNVDASKYLDEEDED
jgi:hypothetical protein